MLRITGFVRAALLMVPFAVLGCGEVSDGDSAPKQDIASRRAAILDAPRFTTGDFPQAAMTAVFGDRVFAVWTAKDPSGVDQIVGQTYALSGQAVTTSQIYSTGTDRKSSPSVAVLTFNGGEARYLITYTDAYMNTNDYDVWGILVDGLGNKQSEFHINFDGTPDGPATVTYVPAPTPQFLVSYTHFDSPGTAAASYKANFVDRTGAVSAQVVIAAPTNDTVSNPSAVYGTTSMGVRRLLFSIGPKTFAFGDPGTLAIGPIKTVPTTGGTISDKVVAYSGGGGSSFGMAWREQQQNGLQEIRSKTFGGAARTSTAAIRSRARSARRRGPCQRRR